MLWKKVSKDLKFFDILNGESSSIVSSIDKSLRFAVRFKYWNDIDRTGSDTVLTGEKPTEETESYSK